MLSLKKLSRLEVRFGKNGFRGMPAAQSGDSRVWAEAQPGLRRLKIQATRHIGNRFSGDLEEDEAKV